MLIPREAPKLSHLDHFLAWLKGHLSDTSDDFEAALKQNTTSSVMFDMYSDHKDFWNHVLSCFQGLIGRS